MKEEIKDNAAEEVEALVNDNIRREKSNLHKYIDEFFAC